MRLRLRLGTDDDLAWVTAIARAPAVEPALAPGAADGLAGAVERGELLVDAERRAAARLVVTVERHRLAAIRTVLVDPAHQGRGVGLALVAALAGHAFATLGLHRLEAEVYGFNAPALRLFDRAGWTREGARRQAWERHGAWQDGVMYGLLAGEG
jgi:RimJ/RimL family protein N-acetyltransferase